MNDDALRERAAPNPPVALTTADLRYLASVMSSLATWAEAKAANANPDPTPEAP